MFRQSVTVENSFVVDLPPMKSAVVIETSLFQITFGNLFQIQSLKLCQIVDAETKGLENVIEKLRGLVPTPDTRERSCDRV